MQRQLLAALALIGLAAIALGLWSTGNPAGDPVTPQDPPPVAHAGTLPPAPGSGGPLTDGTGAKPTAGAAAGGRAEVSAPDVPATLRVRVVGPDGATVPFTPIRVVAEADPVDDSGFAAAWGDQAETDTDAAGSAELRLPAGTYRIHGALGGSVGCELLAGATTAVELRLPAGYTLAGTVVDRLGAPVAGADVWLSAPMTAGASFRGQIVARTDAQGTFRAGPITGPRHVSALHAAFATARMQYAHADALGECRVRIVLQVAPGTLQGTVAGADGQPVANARILVGVEPRAATTAPPPVLTRSDARGRWVARGLVPGKVPVAVRAAGFGLWIGEVELAAGQGGHLAVSLTEAASLVGTVRDADGPVAGVLVKACGREGVFTLQSTRTDDAGEYRLDGLGAGGCRAWVAAEGGPSTTLSIAPGQQQRWDPVWAEPAATGQPLRGRLTDHRGLPLADWWITARSQGSEGVVYRVRTDQTGAFRVDGLRDGGTLQLTARRPDSKPKDWPDAIRNGVTVDGAAVAWQLPELGATRGTLRLRVLGPDGAPLAVPVNFWHETLHFYHLERTDADGRLSAVLPAGTVSFDVNSPDHPGVRRLGQQVPGGGVLDLGDLVLARGCAVFGRVLTAAGTPVANATVLLLGPNGNIDASVQGGSYRCRDVMPGDYSLLVMAEGHAPSRIPVRLVDGEQRELDAQVVSGAQRVFRLTLPDAHDAGGWAALRVLNADDQVLGLYGMALGTGGVEARVWLAPGAYRIVATAARGWRAATELRVDGPAEAPPIELPLRRLAAASRRGRCVARAAAVAAPHPQGPAQLARQADPRIPAGVVVHAQPAQEAQPVGPAGLHRQPAGVPVQVARHPHQHRVHLAGGHRRLQDRAIQVDQHRPHVVAALRQQHVLGVQVGMAQAGLERQPHGDRRRRHRVPPQFRVRGAEGRQRHRRGLQLGEQAQPPEVPFPRHRRQRRHHRHALGPQGAVQLQFALHAVRAGVAVAQQRRQRPATAVRPHDRLQVAERHQAGAAAPPGARQRRGLGPERRQAERGQVGAHPADAVLLAQFDEAFRSRHRPPS